MTRILVRCASLATAAGLCAAAVGQNIGPSTTTAPYVLPVIPQASTTSILTVGDTAGGYRMVGIPDGLGALTEPGNTNFTLLMTHEIAATSGVVRAHGSRGAFVSRWDINPTTLTVNAGRDHNTSPNDVYTWQSGGYAAGTTAFSRFCSADLAAPGAYKFGSLGTDARIFMGGEEVADGRAFAHVVSGPGMNATWQLPRLGRYSWENAVASPYAQQKTVVVGLDDSSPGQVYMYVGNKTDTGNDIERAGLTNGTKYGIMVQGLTDETRNSVIAPNTPFSLYDFGDVTNLSGAQLQAASEAAGVTEFLRPEDGAWDPRPGHEGDFYFVTTDRFNSGSQVGRSRLYRMRFADITNPEAGGTITALLNGDEGQQMMDNLCIDSHGRILIQEDPGNQDHLAKIWMYDTNTDELDLIASHNAAFFQPGLPGFLTRDEESSGIIDARDILGDGWYLFDSQAHYGIPGELVEGGQLLALYVDPTFPEPASLLLLVLGGLTLARRR